jgi:hypothetical protein
MPIIQDLRFGVHLPWIGGGVGEDPGLGTLFLVGGPAPAWAGGPMPYVHLSQVLKGLVIRDRAAPSTGDSP